MKATSNPKRETPPLTPSSQKQKNPMFSKENQNPNTMPSFSGSSHLRSKPLCVKSRSPLPPRPPPSGSANPSGNPLKRKLSLDTIAEAGSPASISSDSGVQVVVRMRPLKKEEEESGSIVQKISPNSVSILDHSFTFDSVADTKATQQDIFQLVGHPLVENCLAGFNSSIFAYGQTGSGKTYTMWGPPSALSAKDSMWEERGLTPRVFERLFSRIQEVQLKHADKQLVYQCRCSFLEIYNEQIMDLFDPTQRNLQIREGAKTGIYVDCLTEENVSSVKDVIQLLDRGLANRRVGATSLNAESSRSHCVFTCVVESLSKNTADGLSNLRTSRINLVDLAGSERQKLTGAAGERLKEAGNINRSLSQLGNLINILAEVSQSGKTRHIPYRDSRLTFLLQESLGGNAKLAMICAISPAHSCKSETFSTLRFAQRAKAIKNQAVVNEVTHDDVNVLREQIRQLKDELLRMKSVGTSPESNGNRWSGWNVRRSLNLLKMSLNCPRVLPTCIDDSDEEMEINEEDVEKANEVAASKQVIDMEVKSSHSNDEVISQRNYPMRISKMECTHENNYEAEQMAIEGNREVSKVKEIKTAQVSSNSCLEEPVSANEVPEILSANVKSPSDHSMIEKTEANLFVVPYNNMLIKEKYNEDSACQKAADGRDSLSASVADPSHGSPQCMDSLTTISIVPCQTSPVLQTSMLSISPRFENSSRKSQRTSTSLSASQGKLVNSKPSSEVQSLSFADMLEGSNSNDSLVRSNMNSLSPTEHIEVSLHRGLQIIESHQQDVGLRGSAFRFSTKPSYLKKVDVGIQTLPQESEILVDSSVYVCSYCKNRPPPLEYSDADCDRELQLIPVDGSDPADKCKNTIPKAVEKVLAGAIRREMALEDHCTKQAAEIMQLNRLIKQYKHERECSAVIGQTREDKISRLESLMDGIITAEEFMDGELIALINEHKLLKEKFENHPEVLQLNIELKRVQDEIDGYRNFFDMGERDVLMEEIQDLKCQLQHYIDSSTSLARNQSPLKHLTNSVQPVSAPLSIIPESTLISIDEKLEEERRHWTETESKWISLSEELRVELEANRSLAEKRKTELDSERKCSEELKEALQTAMQGHARILEQFADLQEKYLSLLEKHREMTDGIEDVKKAAAKAGVKGTESKFIKSLAAEISALRVEREKERRYWRDEKKGLHAQLRDTVEAVQAAGELLVRLKEAEESATVAEKRALRAELETHKAYEEIDNLKKSYEQKIATLNQFLAESRLPKEALKPAVSHCDTQKYDGESLSDEPWREEFAHFEQGDAGFSRGTEPHSWFSDYDRCNI